MCGECSCSNPHSCEWCSRCCSCVCVYVRARCLYDCGKPYSPVYWNHKIPFLASSTTFLGWISHLPAAPAQCIHIGMHVCTCNMCIVRKWALTMWVKWSMGLHHSPIWWCFWSVVWHLFVCVVCMFYLSVRWDQRKSDHFTLWPKFYFLIVHSLKASYSLETRHGDSSIVALHSLKKIISHPLCVWMWQSRVLRKGHFILCFKLNLRLLVSFELW